MSDASNLVLEAADAGHASVLVELFACTGISCHCQYWHFSGDKNAWLDRIFNAPEENRAAFVSALARQQLKGVVALYDGAAVGWLKLCAAESIPKLYEQRLYKGLPCFSGEREGVLTVGCLLVREDWRRRGVARALVQKAIVLGGTARARSIEAFPRRTEQAGDAELWTGPYRVFLEAGFRIVNDFGPYPVLRYDLGGIQP